MYIPERRRDTRISLARGVKIRNELTGKYLAGSTINLSVGGALMLLDYPVRLLPGQRIRAGICRHPQQAILAAEDLAEATVIRSQPDRERQRVAITFDQRQVLPAAA